MVETKKEQIFATEDEIKELQTILDREYGLEQTIVTLATKIDECQKRRVHLWEDFTEKYKLPNYKKFDISLDSKTREFVIKKKDC